MTTYMNPTIDRMLGLTADIAEELLLVKDAGSGALPDGLKLKIISLAELAATTEAPVAADDAITSEAGEAGKEEAHEMAEGAQAMEAEETMEAEAILDAQHTSGAVSALTEDEAETDLQVAEEEATPEDERVADAGPVRRLDSKALFQAFSINDAFLFRREIFGGSKERFLDSLDHIATLPDSHALREYLCGALRLDLDQYPGKEFYQALVVFF